MLKTRIALVGLAFLMTFAMARPAYAYLDPGTGSMMLQLLLGGAVGALVAGKLYWQKLKDFFQRSDKKEEERGGDT